MNVIERWKNNEKPFGLTDEEMREKDREIRMKNKCEADFEVYGLDGEWRFYGNMNTPTMGTVLRLRADYQEPDEYVECEIEWDNSAQARLKLYGGWHGLYSAQNYTEAGQYQFCGYLFEDGTMCMGSPAMYKTKNGIALWSDMDKLKSGEVTVIRATHVVFKKVGEK